MPLQRQTNETLLTLLKNQVTNVILAFNHFTDGIILFLQSTLESKNEKLDFGKLIEEIVKETNAFLNNTVQSLKPNLVSNNNDLVNELFENLNKIDLTQENTFPEINEKQKIKLGNDNFVQHFSKLTSFADYFAAQMGSVATFISSSINPNPDQNTSSNNKLTTEEIEDVKKQYENLKMSDMLKPLYNVFIKMEKTIDKLFYNLFYHIESPTSNVDGSFGGANAWNYLEHYQSESRTLAILEYFALRLFETPENKSLSDFKDACLEVTPDSFVMWSKNAIVNERIKSHFMTSFLKVSGYDYKRYVQLVQLIIGNTYVAQTLHYMCNSVLEINLQMLKNEQGLGYKINQIMYSLSVHEEKLETEFVNDKYFGLAKDVL